MAKNWKTGAQKRLQWGALSWLAGCFPKGLGGQNTDRGMPGIPAKDEESQDLQPTESQKRHPTCRAIKRFQELETVGSWR